jgi:isopentenyldiphosphate isomerase
MSEIIPIVDKEDKIIGYKKREKVTEQDIYRVSALWLVNLSGQILLAQRSFKKKYGPGKWGPAVAGTVAKGENYLQNIIKETKEEIGIDLRKYNFKKIDKVFIDKKWKFFCQWYFLQADISLEKFIFPQDEIERLKWMDKSGFEKDLAEHPENYTRTMARHYEVLKKYTTTYGSGMNYQ